MCTVPNKHALKNPWQTWISFNVKGKENPLCVFGMMKMKYTVLPLGFNSNTVPNENCKCDQKLCKVDNQNESWQLFHGCWHSFHTVCLNHETSCPLCRGVATGGGGGGNGGVRTPHFCFGEVF